MAAPLPPRIGRYVVENLVGIGGMGQIFKAHDPDIGRPVAIKLISTELMSSAARAEYIKRFRREAQAAARCAHPNIVAIYDFALHEGQPFIAMEFVYGASLRQALDAAPVMAVPDAVRIMLQVLDALASAHDQGVVHQDVKPANIMLTPEMRVKVADFGICRFVNMPRSRSPPRRWARPTTCRRNSAAAVRSMVAPTSLRQGRRCSRWWRASAPFQATTWPRSPIASRTSRCRCCRRLFAPWRPGCSWCSSGPWESSRRIGSTPVTRWRRPCGRCLAAAAATQQQATRVSPMPVAGSAPAQKAPADARPGTEPRLDADTLQALEHKLTDYVGPIARILVRTTAGRSRSIADLCSQLASVDRRWRRARTVPA